MKNLSATKNFRKQPREPHAAQAEAAGLRWLGQASDCVAHVISVSDTHIETAMVQRVSPTPEAAYTAGRELAKIHAAGAEAFGSPPPGWDGPNYIGTQTQPCTPCDNWVEFYVTQRVTPFVRRAVDNGNLDAAGAVIVDKACALIPDAVVAPARIHGDLWAGNLIYGAGGPVFIDPAAHGGHPETDIAMLALFGAPYFAEIIDGYGPLADGWEQRIPIHQLHPLAVHAVTHGPHYAHELVDTARAVIATFS